ncbi:unnamed protein product [Pedinophyceae sp. YPF-701]|nr:unnamed protein product [Pedinophyceae sp. YPF-701]
MVANRGEIAIRVIRAAKEMGLQSVAIYSPVDRLMPHRFKADESFQCYLDVEGIIKIAKEHDVDAIHPGYGFLSENTTFARRCREEGIKFIGPDPESIDRMGDKTAARVIAQEAGVPVVPGTDEALKDADAALAFAKEAGFPVIVKAAMGGGGRGMRVVRREEELKDAFLRASNEAQAAFGDGRMFIEKYVEDPRHIEVQILADEHGNVSHLYERDCSVQRRHQKVVEIAPAPNLDKEVRQGLLDAAVRIAKHVGYKNAGTVEFMVDKHGAFYFLEVNPRVQVEHTITEEVTGVDIVQSQIRVAGGATLADIGIASQADVPEPKSFAIQCRLTSEDPERNFQPDTGRIVAYRPPGGPGIRLDGSYGTGHMISRHYDSLLTKIIVRAPTYRSAVQKMYRACNEFAIRGVKTNIPFLRNVLTHPDFLTGDVTTSFIEQNPQLFEFDAAGSLQSSKLLGYLAEQVVNGAKHPGAVGPPPSAIDVDAPAIPKELDIPTSELTGWRDILEAEGPEAWARAVREHKGALLTDTTWRDAHQSLLATRVRTRDIMRAAPLTARSLSGLASLEMWGGATFDVSMRFLKECPWRRLEQIREEVPNIPFQMLLRGANAVGYTTYADNVVYEFVKEAKLAGIDIFRVFDSLNYIDNMLFGIDTVRQAGGVIEGTICYTGDLTDPKRKIYNLDYYMNLAEKLVDAGIHTLAIKDMAGLLKPRAATMLVSALRQRWPELPIHIHTHDTAGTAVATQLAAAEAGADIIDCALDSMSGTTSQPSMGAIVAALQGTDLDTNICPDSISPLIEYWERARGLYAPFESTLRSSNVDVYLHEMPGGQYTNLKFQATSLGLGAQWDKVKRSYAAANRALGDIVKVTPSSKVVGDLAQFMVQNDLDEHTVVERAEELSFPGSVVEFMQGLIGHPPQGFPEPFRTRVLKGKKPIEGRPGATLPPVNLAYLESALTEKYGRYAIDKRDVLSAALYPKVFDEYRAHVDLYGTLTEELPTGAFWAPLDEDQEVVVPMGGRKGVDAHIKFKAVGEMQPDGKREVFFETNGIPRVVEVVDTNEPEVGAGGGGGARKGMREKATSGDLGSVGAPMAGEVIDVQVKPGQKVEAGQSLVVMSAMKMETTVGAPTAGVVSHVAVEAGDAIDAGDLIVKIGASGDNGDEPAAAAPQAAEAAQ